MSAIGVLHSLIALGCWGILFVRLPRLGIDLSQLPSRTLFELVLIPLFHSVLLLVAFGVALQLSFVRSRFAEPSLMVAILYAAVAFLVDTQHSLAQVHVLGEPGINHIFCTWPVYSAMPYLSLAVRIVTAVTIVVVSAVILWMSSRAACSTK